VGLFKKKKFIIGGLVILIAIGILGFKGFQSFATYYYSVSEVASKGATLQNQTIRLAGQVAPGSVVRNDSTGMMQFQLLDPANASAQAVGVSYKGGVPDGFKEGNDAVVEGTLTSMKTFDATQIIVKCPSKYVPKQ
jgi:cytochrome c-type biogenesis protein CcmE